MADVQGKKVTSTTLEELRPHFDAEHFPQFNRDTLEKRIVALGGSSVLFRGLFVPEVEALNNKGITNLAIVSVSCGTEASSRAKADSFREQGGLYTLHEHDGTVDRFRLIGSITDSIFATDEPAKVYNQIADPRTQVVTMTITSRGYNFKGVGSELDLDNPSVRQDIENPTTPVTALGYVLQGLALRQQAGQEPPIILPLENVSDSGKVIKQALLTMAQERDKLHGTRLAEYVRDQVHVPQTMVDKICPALKDQTLEAERAHLASHGLHDALPVTGEPFGKLVIADTDPRIFDILPFQKLPESNVAVATEKEMHAYEVGKLRMLNGGHRAIGILGLSAGEKIVHETIAKTDIREFIHGMSRETHQTLPLHADMHRTFSPSTVISRFSNSSIQDDLGRLVDNSSSKLLDRIVRPIRHLRDEGQNAPHLTFVMAAWFNLLRGENDHGHPAAFKDDNAAKLGFVQAAKEVHANWKEAAKTNPAAQADLAPLLKLKDMQELLGSLAKDEHFLGEVSRQVSSIWKVNAQRPGRGTLEALQAVIRDTQPRRDALHAIERTFSKDPVQRCPLPDLVVQSETPAKDRYLR